MKKIKILLTFDYELPLGSAGDYRKALFDPGHRLLELARELEVPVILFADICSAIRFKAWDHANYYRPFRDQLHQALKQGSDVQLHVHPHWMNSSYTNGTFVPSRNFSLSGFKQGLSGYTIERILKEAFDEMVTLCQAVKPDYQCIAFRAGGYDVEPESRRILNTLYDLGIRIESSVIKNFFLDYTFSRIDYSKAPAASQWYISRNGPLTEESGRDLLELPIASKPVGITDILIRRAKKQLNRKEYRSRIYHNTGKGFLAVNGKQGLASKYRLMTNPMVLSFDREHYEYKDLEAIVTYTLEKYRTEKEDTVITAIAHPKSMGPYHFSLLKKFIERMRARYRDQVEFQTYRELYDNLNQSA